MDRTFVFVRHGFTDWNVAGRFQGQLDIPLNEMGLLQAWSLMQILAPTSFDQIYSSPLRRAAETARIIAGHRSITADWRIAEIHHGEWQGKTRQEIASHWPEVWERWNKTPLQVTSSGGESPEQMRRRVEDFLKTVRGQSILCVSHGMVIQSVRSILLHTDPWEDNAPVPQNASIHTFVVDPDHAVRYHAQGLETKILSGK